MKAVIQRVENAKLTADGECVATSGRGLVVYVGIEQCDTEKNIVAFAQKLVAMRIFSDGEGKMNLSVSDIRGDIMLVSNFTLCADISHGNRPSFTGAMKPQAAREMFGYCVDAVTDLLRNCGGNVSCGVFGADMKIEQVNAGPVTIIY